MKNTLTILTLLTVAIFAAGCGNTLRYSSQDVKAKAHQHQTVAIVPAIITYTGPVPQELTREDKIAIDIGESRMYQNSLYNFLLRKSNTRVRVNIQPIERTNNLLRDADINIHESWAMDATELAQVLGVDAVIQLRVDESRYMSDLTGLGIDAGRGVLRSIFYGPGNLGPYPYPITRTADMRSSCSVFDADGSLIWKMGVIRGTNWSRPPEFVVDNINRKFARNFPYR